MLLPMGDVLKLIYWMVIGLFRSRGGSGQEMRFIINNTPAAVSVSKV
jgi:hypothetical protein